MKLFMPQEIQVWYILPALRREFAKCLVEDFKLSKKDTAEMLSVTESAISQYFKSKRAKEIVFNDSIKEQIKQACKNVVDGKTILMEEIYNLSINEQVTKSTCTLHMKYSKSKNLYVEKK